MIKMVGYVQSLERLSYPLSEEFATDVILNSLPSAYGAFISNYHMHGMDKKVTKIAWDAQDSRGRHQKKQHQSSVDGAGYF